MVGRKSHRLINVFYLMSFFCAALILIYLTGGGVTSSAAHNRKGRSINANPPEVLRSYPANAQLRQTGFVKQVPYRVYLYSASAFFTKSFKLKNSAKNSDKKVVNNDDVHDIKINVNAWVYREYLMHRATCCIKLQNDKLVQINVNDDVHYINRTATLFGLQFTCFLRNVTANVSKVSLEFIGNMCQDNHKFDLPINFIQKTPQQREGKRTIGVCLKLVYGNASASRLVEWVEAVRHLGADFIFAYLHQLNDEARKVMEFYRDLGVVEFVDGFSFPEKTTVRREVGDKDVNAYHDEQVVLFDCMDRLHYYHYVTALDFDEFLIPNRVNFKNAWRIYFDKAFRGKVGVLAFNSRMVDIKNTPQQSEHPLLLGRYTVSTAPLADRTKLVFMPTRVKPSTVHTHAIQPARGFERLPGEGGAFLFHFRACSSLEEPYPKRQPLSQRLQTDLLTELLPDGLNTSLSSIKQMLMLKNENISLCEDFRIFRFRIISDFADAIVSNVITVKRHLNI